MCFFEPGPHPVGIEPGAASLQSAASQMPAVNAIEKKAASPMANDAHLLAEDRRPFATRNEPER